MNKALYSPVTVGCRHTAYHDGYDAVIAIDDAGDLTVEPDLLPNTNGIVRMKHASTSGPDVHEQVTMMFSTSKNFREVSRAAL